MNPSGEMCTWGDFIPPCSFHPPHISPLNIISGGFNG